MPELHDPQKPPYNHKEGWWLADTQEAIWVAVFHCPGTEGHFTREVAAKSRRLVREAIWGYGLPNGETFPDAVFTSIEKKQ